MIRTLCSVMLVGAVVAVAHAGPTHTGPLAVAPDGAVFVVNPDSSTVARLDFSGIQGVLTDEAPVGAYPRTVTLSGSGVFTANQKGDTVSRCDQAALGNCTSKTLGPGCDPYGITATPSGDALLVSCQGSSELVVLTPSLDETARVKLPWPQARAIAVSSDGARAYVTHFITAEPGTDAHVSVVDLNNKSVSAVFAITADTATCETQNSGQGVLNQLSSIALIPDGAPADVAGQLWVGGEQENNISKGIFKRDSSAFCDQKKVGKGKKRHTVCVPKPGAALFPLVTFAPFPEQGGISRNKYQPSFHDIIRFGIIKLSAADGTRVGKIDIDEAAIATDIDFSADGTAAFVVDQTFNSFHVFNTRKGQGSDVTTLFAPPSSLGPGGADPSMPCLPAALPHVTSEVPFRIAPQAQIVTINGYDPIDSSFNVVPTGVDFDALTYYETSLGGGTPVSQMRAVADGIGTAPLGVRVAPSGDRVYVFNYLARNVVAVAGPGNDLRCSNNASLTCETDTDCQQGARGFCNHPGGAACNSDGDCGTMGPCVRTADCIPLVLAGPVSTITGRCPDVVGKPACKSDADCASGACVGIAGDPVPPSILDGKILFTTAARDASVVNDIGLGQAAPRFNEPSVTCQSGDHAGQKCLSQKDCGDPALRLCSVGHNMPGELVSVAHDASYVSCTTCHADFGGQDGRTWDFSQFGASLRNTMDLRGRPGFAPGTCAGGPNTGQSCTFDAACGDGFRCKANPATVPPNVPAADRDRWFNPMLTVHWNGDRDEVEDFEFTFRELQGSGDCDGLEDLTKACMGALVSRDSAMTVELPRPNTLTPPVNDVEPDLGPPNRNLPGVAGNNVGVRLTHVADFVYSLTDFVKNPNPPTDATERGRTIFNDPSTQCGDCHNGGYGGQFFTDKAPVAQLGPGPARGDVNNPFKRHDVGTANIFDQADPYQVGLAAQVLQNTTIPIPASRAALGDYVTPVLVDLWNTAPYLHDGSAPDILDVIRPCDTTLDACTRLGAGRSLHDAGTGRHGKTDILTPQQLNDLVAFQKSLTKDTVLGTRARVVNAGTMTITNAKLSFGKVKSGVRGPGSFKLVGTLGNAPAADPSVGVTVQIGTPAAGTMAIFEQAMPMTAQGKRFASKTPAGAGAMSLSLTKKKDGTYRFVLIGKRLDLAALDTGNPDVTVAFLVGDAQFVRNRTLVQKKQTYGLPKKKG